MRILKRIIIAIAFTGAITYCCDDLYARVRNNPFAEVNIERFFAVQQKFNKVSYERTDAVTERCVYALFPHFGNKPCWYLKRHTLQFIQIG